MGYNWAKKKMKKSLLQTSLLCLTIAVIGSFYSFKSPNNESSPTIKEVVIEDNLCGCDYRLYVENGTGWWYLKLKNMCSDPIIATCKYTIYYDDGTHKSYTENVRLNGNWETIVASGNSDHSSCTADDVSAQFTN